MRVLVDPDRCEAHGNCESLVPEVFALDDDDQLHYDAWPDEALRVEIEQAVRGCPVQAIRLEE